MTDSYQQIREKFAGITRGAEIQQRVQQDAALKAAIALETESRAEAQRRAEALAREAGIIAEAEARTVAILATLPDLYAQREAVARAAIEAIASLWRVEQDIRAGLSNADRAAGEVTHFINETRRGAWRASLRERAGLPSRHIFTAPKQMTDAQRAGATCVMGLTGGFIADGWIQSAHDRIDFEFG